MTPEWPAMLGLFVLAAVFFTVCGLPLARMVAPQHMPPLALAPALGWAVFNAGALPLVASGLGMSRFVTLVLALAALCAAACFWRRIEGSNRRLLRFLLPVAAGLAILPAMAIMPKMTAAGLVLAPPMFDHVKIALVDALLQHGLPVVNPFYGPDPQGHLAYYYLWHFGTAFMARLLGCSAWTAEAGMTAFTAYASLCLVAGMARAFGGSSLAALAAMLLLLPGSLRPLLAAAIGQGATAGLIPQGAEIGGWLNQAAWVPQHLAGACCALVASLLIVRLAERPCLAASLCLGLSVAAGFESSVWAGGIAFACAAPLLTLWVLADKSWVVRREFAIWLGLAACLSLLLVAPFVMSEWTMLQQRHVGGMQLAPYPVLGRSIPGTMRTVLDVPAFWVALPYFFPALIPLGILGLFVARARAAALGVFVLACLLVSAWLRSTIDNNDLGWRSVLPVLLVLAAAGGVALSRGATHYRRHRILCVIGLLAAAAGVPDTMRMVREYAAGTGTSATIDTARETALWQAVRAHSGPLDRIANNPLALAGVTPWPVNIGWALFSRRPSCFAGWESVIAYGPLPLPSLVATSERVSRAFDGKAAPGDLDGMIDQDGCRVAVVTSNDAAWGSDPFAASTRFRLTAASSSWRIYRAVQTVGQGGDGGDAGTGLQVTSGTSSGAGAWVGRSTDPERCKGRLVAGHC